LRSEIHCPRSLSPGYDRWLGLERDPRDLLITYPKIGADLSRNLAIFFIGNMLRKNTFRSYLAERVGFEFTVGLGAGRPSFVGGVAPRAVQESIDQLDRNNVGCEPRSWKRDDRGHDHFQSWHGRVGRDQGYAQASTAPASTVLGLTQPQTPEQAKDRIELMSRSSNSKRSVGNQPEAGVTGPGRRVTPAQVPEDKSDKAKRRKPRSVPAPGVPVTNERYEWLKEQARTVRMPPSKHQQVDPTRKR
jgi:hypothetical protein